MTPPPFRPPLEGPAGAGELRQAAHAAALAGLPGMGPAGLVAILRERSPVEAWEDVRAGRLQRPSPRRRGSTGDGPPAGGDQAALFGAGPSAAGRSAAGRSGGGPLGAGPSGAGTPPPAVRARRPWADVARRTDPVAWWTPFAASGIGVTWPGREDYPAALVDDPQPPGVLFWTGSLGCLDGLCVAIVGTRHATPDGRAVAFEMGRDLAAAGVCVVSGLALGIDGAAHAGAVAAAAEGAAGRTVGVAASGVDVPYPRRHTRLWHAVASTGAIVSENLPGRPAQAWRFPSRNRVIAGLVRMVVVVESHMCGGSLITAEAAIERGVDVRVVPGPVHSPASAGSNQLLYDGPGPVRGAQDVLDALGFVRPAGRPAAAGDGHGATGRSGAPTGRSGAPPDRPGAPPDPTGRLVLDALGWRPTSTGQVMARTGLDAATVLRSLEALQASGHITEEAGWWVRRNGGRRTVSPL